MSDRTTPEKFRNTFEISYENYIMARFKPMIGIIRKFMEEIGKEKALHLVSEFMDETTVKSVKQTVDKNPIENFSQFKTICKNAMSSELYNNSTTFTIIEDSENKLEFKITECLWAKTMQQLDFDGEPGYITCCKSDYAMAKAFHPNVKLTRTKTLMQGDEYCDHTYTWKQNK